MPCCKGCGSNNTVVTAVRPFLLAYNWKCRDCGRDSLWFYWEG